MSRYKVYSKDGATERCTLNKVEYNGSFMDSRSVNATVESPTPISFEIYDYIIYRGEKFELDYKPTSVKNSSTNTVGNAYSYELQFVSLKYELERCEMRDLVPYDNGLVYPTPLTIEFTGNASKLAERIQTCLDALYTGSHKWTITVLSSVSDDEKNISISQSNCWSAVSLFNTEYGLNFYISGRTITVGDAGTAIDFTFQYGKGKGLYKIERTSDTDQGIVTRIRAYGGTENIGDNYLRDKTEWPDSVLPASMYIPNLMLPGFETTQIDYIESDTVEEYGIREGSVVYEDIYPSIVGMTNSKGERIDKIKSAETITDDAASEFWITTYDLEFEKPLSDYIVTGGIPTVYIKSGQLQGYSFEINTNKIDEQSDGGYKLYLSRNTDNGYTVPNSDLNLTSGIEFVFLGITMPKAYIEAAENKLLARAQEYLAKYGQTNYGYEIGLDEIFAARNESIYDSLYEGKKLKVVDADLSIDEEITIQNLKITEEDGGIPTYKITLNNEVSASTLNRIQGQVSQLESTVTNGFTLLQWQTEQYYRRMGRPYALWTRDGTTQWLYSDEDGNPNGWVDLPLLAKKDVVAFADNTDIPDLSFPIASYTSLGAVSIKQGGGLVIDGNGMVSIDPNFTGGGLDENALQEYLTERHYLTPTGLLYGYVQNTDTPLITASDSVNAAFKKLENKLLSIDGNYVTLTTDQTITGQKTFEKTVISKADVVAYVAGSIEDLVAIATTTTYGLIKYDGSVFSINTSGQLTLTDGAGGGLTNVVSSGSGNAVTELSYNNDTKVLTWTKGSIFALRSEIPTIPTAIKNPYSLSWSGYSSGSYDGSSAKSISIPNNTNQLTNGAGFISGITKSMVMNVLNGTKNSNYFLDGSGTFSTITTSDISGLSGEYVTISTTQRITGQKTYSAVGWYDGKGILKVGPSNGTYLIIADGNGDCINSVNSYGNTGNLYLNYRSLTGFTRIDGTNNIITSGDVVSFSASSSISDIVAIATSTSYGVVKYDGDTIRVNSYGQLYVASGGDSGSTVSWGTEDTYWHIVPLTVNGVSKTVTLSGHTHGWSSITEKPSWIGSSKPSYSWSEIGGKPSGLVTSVYISGSGNAVINASFSSGTLTFTKGSISGGGGISSINYSVSGSGNVVTNVTASGSTVYVTKGNVSGGGSWNGGTVTQDITVSKNGAILRLRHTSSDAWSIMNNGNQELLFYQTSHNLVAKINSSGQWIQVSDRRLKDITGNVSGILQMIQGIGVYRFTFKSNPTVNCLGVIAQEVQTYFPELVTSSPRQEGGTDMVFGLDYSTLGVIVSIQGLKELYQKHLSLENLVKSRKHWELTKDEQIKHLQDTVIRLQNEINELKGEAA